MCQNCFIKFNEYDEHVAAANKIQEHLIGLFELTSSVEMTTDEALSQNEVDTTVMDVGKFDDESCIDEIDDESQITTSEDKGNKISNIKPIKAQQTNEKIPDNSAKQVANKDADEGLLVSYVNGVKIYECDICGKKFPNRRYRLTSHREIHSLERNFICTVCNATFKTSNCLRNHSRVHRDRVHFCDLCPVKVKQKNEMRIHMNTIHLQRKDYKCHICGKSYGRDKTLRQHLTYHANVKKISCELCNFKAITKAKIQRHMKTHTGERNYGCPICPKRFIYSYNVTQHVRNVHNKEKRRPIDESKLTCSFCRKKFRKVWKVREHITESHPEMIEFSEAIEEILDYTEN